MKYVYTVRVKQGDHVETHENISASELNELEQSLTKIHYNCERFDLWSIVPEITYLERTQCTHERTNYNR